MAQIHFFHRHKFDLLFSVRNSINSNYSPQTKFAKVMLCHCRGDVCGGEGHAWWGEGGMRGGGCA